MLIFVSGAVCAPPPATARPHTGTTIAVVRNQFDNIERLLQVYRIPFSMIEYRDLEDEKTFLRYKTIFFPCGADIPLETNINIAAHGSSIQAVFLKDDYYEINREIVYRNIRNFLKNGGVCYFSEFSFFLLRGAFGDFSFFKNFPFLGSAGAVSLSLEGDLACFCNARRMSVSIHHSGWVAVRSMRDAQALATGTGDTAIGRRRCLIAASQKKDRGQVYYTGYHTDDPSSLYMRFFAYRACFPSLLARAREEVRRWDQTVTASVTDSILPGESSRSYLVPVERGNNTLYFFATSGFYHLEVFNRRGELLLSRLCWERSFAQTLKAPRADELIVRVFPSGSKPYAPFAVAAGSGFRIVPYWKRTVLIACLLSLIIALFIASRILSPRKYSGRPR